MTKLLEQAIAQLKALPESDQDEVAEFLFSFVARREDPEQLDPQTRDAIHEGLAQIERGDVYSEEEMAEIFRRFGA
jgi:predicted transcriptional regulator